MAQTSCRECKAGVDAKVDKCPQCGASNPGVSKKDIRTGWFLLAGVGAIVVTISSMWGASEEERAADQAASAAATAAAEAACRKDLACIGEKGVIAAGFTCVQSVERLAKHSVKWTDGTLEPKFSHYRWRDQSAGHVTFIGDKVQFQNGFGAFTNMIYECDLDMSTDQKAVVDVRVKPGRL